MGNNTVSYTSNLLVQFDRPLLSAAVPTVNISMFTSKIINHVKKINISFRVKHSMQFSGLAAVELYRVSPT